MAWKIILDPTPTRAALIAICLFFFTFLSALGTITAQGSIPSNQQIIAAVVAAGTATSIYLLGFLGYEKEEAK